MTYRPTDGQMGSEGSVTSNSRNFKFYAQMNCRTFAHTHIFAHTTTLTTFDSQGKEPGEPPAGAAAGAGAVAAAPVDEGTVVDGVVTFKDEEQLPDQPGTHYTIIKSTKSIKYLKSSSLTPGRLYVVLSFTLEAWCWCTSINFMSTKDMAVRVSCRDAYASKNIQMLY